MAHMMRFHASVRPRRLERRGIGTVAAGIAAMLALAGMVGGLLAVAAWATSRLLLGVFS
ncbi:hypothetical protein [Nocardioides sp. Iso805N]|uniref:hypothetical protein n=1 Tax=Nocardioides sp. Iso805N TaxID=1283287 RepID=UPI00036E9C1C|nr:hypothetical protein [Nocardioides sp. Iso805N]